MTAVAQTAEKKERQSLDALLKNLRKFFNSYLFYAIETAIAALFVFCYQEVLGAVFFVVLLSVLLVVCDDILPTTLPFLLISTFTTNCYDSFNEFIQYIAFAPVPVAALLYHFVVYHKKFRLGRSVYGICAVSIAILLGGVGNFSFATYFKGAYYYFGLSLGMLVAYVLMKAQFVHRNDYDFRERFSWVMTLVGFLCVIMILTGYARDWFGWRYNAYGQRGFSRNNICTVLMFAMPFPLFLAKKKEWLAIFTVVLYAAICVTTSRGGLLFGSVEFAVCCVYWMFQGKVEGTDTVKIRLSVCLIAIGAILIACGQVIADVLVNRILADEAIEGSDRYVMILQAFIRFENNPFVGSGLLDNTIVYSEYKKAGTMSWYHMMIPQIIGSMGIVGILGYGFQIWDRFAQVFTKTSRWSLILGISYLGVLLMSQVNPGEFCPVPYEVLAVLLFILQEQRVEADDLPLTRDGMVCKRKQ